MTSKWIIEASMPDTSPVNKTVTPEELKALVEAGIEPIKYCSNLIKSIFLRKYISSTSANEQDIAVKFNGLPEFLWDPKKFQAYEIADVDSLTPKYRVINGRDLIEVTKMEDGNFLNESLEILTPITKRSII